MNNSFTFVLAIIIIVSLSGLAKAYLKQRTRQPERDDELRETLLKIDELEERVKVLERIVTESKYDLKKEIDRL